MWSVLNDLGPRLSRRDAGALAARRHDTTPQGITRSIDLTGEEDLKAFLGRDGRLGDEASVRETERIVRAVLDTFAEAAREGNVDELRGQLPEGFVPSPGEDLGNDAAGEVWQRSESKDNTE